VFIKARQLQDLVDRETGGGRDLHLVVAELYFTLDGVQFDDSALDVLDKTARSLLQNPEQSVEIRAYANDIGNEEANRQLAARRARRVQEYLLRARVDDYRITVLPPGTDANQVAGGASAHGRRAEVLLRGR
jgi:outer membrane protein OmpA-like peptidoglycan-associated protein